MNKKKYGIRLWPYSMDVSLFQRINWISSSLFGYFGFNKAKIYDIHWRKENHFHLIWRRYLRFLKLSRWYAIRSLRCSTNAKLLLLSIRRLELFESFLPNTWFTRLFHSPLSQSTHLMSYFLNKVKLINLISYTPFCNRSFHLLIWFYRVRRERERESCNIT